jgi:hypothetical protein
MRSEPVPFVRCLLALAALAGAPARGEVVESVVAVLDGQPVLASDVRVLEVVRGLGRAEALEATLDERLMFREASRVPQAAVTAEEEERTLARLLEERSDLKTAVPEADLRRLVRRQASIIKYVDFRFRPQVRVTPEEVKKAYDAEYAGKDAPALATVSPALEEKLARQSLDERLEAWVKEMRSAAEIRYNR